MKEQELQNLIVNITNDSNGFQFVKLILEELGAFERGINFQSRDIDLYNRGKREKGLWLLDLISKYNLEKFIEIIKERNSSNVRRN